MNIEDYRREVASLPFGKRLPTAVYVFRAPGSCFGEHLNQLVATLVTRYEIGEAFNVIKFRTRELKVSFLSYPDFKDDPHPALRHAVTIDLVNGKARHTDYAGNPNPPILHRKEAFLPSDHPDLRKFKSLTQAEESAGLYEHTSTIGFKLNWERLLVEKGLEIHGHSLRQLKQTEEEPQVHTPVIDRHKTALSRYDLSKPVKTLLEYGMLKGDVQFFDYGCGQGSDVRGLRALGHDADGWDPVYRNDEPKREADIVNIGYVVNVIEDPAERVEALVDAYRHAKRLLVVSGLISETVESAKARQYGDGVITQRNTFQKFYEQQELQQYIEDVLDATAVPVALGVFYVFCDPSEQQDFLSSRSRRVVDWTHISARLGLGGPQTRLEKLYKEHRDLLDSFGEAALALGRLPGIDEYEQLNEVCDQLGSAKRALRAYIHGAAPEGLDWPTVKTRFGIEQPKKRQWETLYEENKELLSAFWAMMLELGRLPAPEEFPQTAELRERVGSPNQALKIFNRTGGAEELTNAAEGRRRDLLVYVALANLRKRVPFRHLSARLRLDIREFFGNYTRALEKGMELLYAAGDTGEIEIACQELEVGWQDEQALYLHRSLLDELPPVLRAYIGCAATLFGDVAQADVIKLHKASGKATFLVYDDFEGDPLPMLRQRIKVNLRTRWVQVFDHSSDGQLLYFKERVLSANDPRRASMESLSAKLRRLGIYPDYVGRGPLRKELNAVLARNGLNENLNKRKRPARGLSIG